MPLDGQVEADPDRLDIRLGRTTAATRSSAVAVDQVDRFLRQVVVRYRGAGIRGACRPDG